MIDFSELTINRLCIHTIHAKALEDTATAECEDILTKITTEVEVTLKMRLIKAFSAENKSFELHIARIEENSFFYLSKDLRRLEEPAFIERTKVIAELLASSQKQSNIPGGYLVVIDAIDENARTVVIVIKAELDEGIKRSEGGHLELVKDIFLGKGDKLFKIAILFKKEVEDSEESYPNDEWGAYLFDDQFRPGNKPSEYFWKKFLGLSIDKNSAIMTAIFYEEVNSFINRNVVDFEKQRLASSTLDNIMVNSEPIIELDRVKAQLFDEDLHDDFINKMHENFPGAFIKNLGILEKRMSNQKIYFGNTINLSGRKDVVGRVKVVKRSQVKTTEIPEGYTLLLVPGTPSTKKK